MKKRGVIFGEQASRQIQDTVREVARQMMNEMPHRGRWTDTPENRVQVRMKEDLFAAPHSLTDPSTAQAYILRKQGTDDLVQTTDEITIVNRNQFISVDAGKYCKAEWIDGEWQLYNADCPGDQSSGSI